VWYVKGAVYARAPALQLHMTLAIIILLHLCLGFLCYCLSDKVINRAPVIIQLRLSRMCFCDEMQGNMLFARHSWGIDSQSPILHIGKLVHQRHIAPSVHNLQNIKHL
jgi:hypothetical protein